MSMVTKLDLDLAFQKSLVVGQNIALTLIKDQQDELHNWAALDGSDFMGIGTHLKYYIEEGQTFNDITPLRNTTSAR